MRNRLIFIICIIILLFNGFAAEDNSCVKEFPRVDLMQNFDKWIAYEIDRDGVWDSGIDVPVNDNGYPRIIPFEKYRQKYGVRTIIPLEKGADAGKYNFSFKGSGEIKLGYDAKEISFDKSGSYMIDVNPTGEGIYLEIVRSDILDAIYDIRIITPIKKELIECEINDTKNQDNKSDFIVVSDTDLVGDVDNLDVSMNRNLKDKVATGLFVAFAILAIIYILK